MFFWAIRYEFHDVAQNLPIIYLSTPQKLVNNKQLADSGFRFDEGYATTEQTNFQLQMT